MNNEDREKLDAAFGRATAAAAIANCVAMTLAVGLPILAPALIESLDAASLQIEDDVKRNAAAEGPLNEALREMESLRKALAALVKIQSLQDPSS
jgi:hypothetical protein